MLSKVKKRNEVLSDNSKVTDEEIIKDIFAGRVDYFEYLIRRYNNRFYRIARAHNIQDPYCDKLIRDSFLKIYANLKYFKGNSSFATWAAKLHLQHCQSFLQNWNKYKLGSNKLYAVNQHMSKINMVRKEINNIYEKGISKLPKTMRIIFILKETENLSFKQIASYLEISELKVRINYFRSKLFLRKYTHYSIRKSEILKFPIMRCDEVVQQVFVEIRQLKIAFALSN